MRDLGERNAVVVCRRHLTERIVGGDGDGGSGGGARGWKLERTAANESPVGERSVGSCLIRQSWLERKPIDRDADGERREVDHRYD